MPRLFEAWGERISRDQSRQTVDRLTSFGELLAGIIELEKAAGRAPDDAEARALARLGIGSDGPNAVAVERCECLLRTGVPPRQFGRHLATLIAEEERSGDVRGAERRALARLGGADALNELGECLLRAGIARPSVIRYLLELKEHLADLTAEEERAGCRWSEAQSRAYARLGSMEVLAKALIDREGRAWSARAAWAAFFVGPSVGLATVLALLVYSTNAAARIWPNSLLLLDFARTGISLLLPIFLGWYLGYAANRQRIRPFWPVLGMIAISIIGGTAHAELDWTSFSQVGPGESGFGSTLVPGLPVITRATWDAGTILLFIISQCLPLLWIRNLRLGSVKRRA